MDYNIFFKTINLKLYIKSKSIQRMQQDDQNTFKKHSSLIHTQILLGNTNQSTTTKPNLILKINRIRDGINFIVPSFWYQELIRVNQSTKSVQDITFPSFELLVRFLRLYALENPSESPFQMNQRYCALSSGFLADLIEQNNFNVSKTLRFSKLNDLREWNEIQWSLISAELWNLIENRFNFRDLKEQEQQNVKNKHTIEYIQVQSYEQLPRLGIRLGKQWILQKGQIRCNKVTTIQQHPQIQITYNSRRYYIVQQQLQKQIFRQLRLLSNDQTNFLLIIDYGRKNRSLLLKKLIVAGFFQQDISFKQLIKSLLMMECCNKEKLDVGQKYYITDQNGERVSEKINTIATLNTLTQQKYIIVSTLPIYSINQRKLGLKNTLSSLLSSVDSSNISYKSSVNELKARQSKDGNTRQMQQVSRRIGYLLYRHAWGLQYQGLKRMITLIGRQQDQNAQSNKEQIRSGFKLYNNQTTSFKTNQTNTVTNALNSILKLSQPNQHTSSPSTHNIQLGHHQNVEDFRMLESLTTNMDTPLQSEQSHHQSSNTSYQNKRLNRCSSKQERKKKSQSYLQKKKRNTVILKDNSNSNKGNHAGEYKKRVRHCLFRSLATLQPEDQTLAFLISNMNIVAKENTIVSQQLLISHPYVKQQTTQNQNDVSEEKQQEYKQHSSYSKQKVNSQNREEYSIIQANNDVNPSLQQLAELIQQRYEQHLPVQKQSFQEMQKIEIYSEYDPQLLMKKDNEEIKTIVDNSEGPYSQVQKQQIGSAVKQRYRMQSRRRQIGQQMEIEEGNNDEVNSMTDALNYIEDNQQTL